MKSILFVSPTGTLDNGAEVTVFYLMKELVNKGYQVINAYPHSFKAEQKVYVKKCSKAGIQLEKLVALKWWWEDAPGERFGSPFDREKSYQQNVADLRKIINDNNIDLVITNTVNIFTGALAAAAEKTPHYWLIHEFPENEFSYYLNKISFVESYSTNVYAVVGKLTQKISELLPDKMIKSFFSYTAVDNHSLRLGNKRRILSIGRISERKNQLELLAAYKELHEPGLELVFIGPWDELYKKRCDKYVKKEKLNNVTFKGHMTNPWEEVTEEDICVFPSSMETFGMAYVESILLGIPTILSDNPGHLSAFDIFQKGSIYQLGDVMQLTKSISNLLEHFSDFKKSAKIDLEKVWLINQVEIAFQNLISDIEKDNSTLKEFPLLEEKWLQVKPSNKVTRIFLQVKYLIFKIQRRINKK